MIGTEASSAAARLFAGATPIRRIVGPAEFNSTGNRLGLLVAAEPLTESIRLTLLIDPPDQAPGRGAVATLRLEIIYQTEEAGGTGAGTVTRDAFVYETEPMVVDRRPSEMMMVQVEIPNTYLRERNWRFSAKLAIDSPNQSTVRLISGDVLAVLRSN
jgi:hypothetical protein